jgi:hypothetical protein
MDHTWTQTLGSDFKFSVATVVLSSYRTCYLFFSLLMAVRLLTLQLSFFPSYTTISRIMIHLWNY